MPRRVTVIQVPLATTGWHSWFPPSRRQLVQDFIRHIFSETLSHTPATKEMNMISQAGCLETTPVLLKRI